MSRKAKSSKTVAANAVIAAVKKRKNLADREIYSLLRHDWSASQNMIEQLTYFLTTEITRDGEPIIYPILEEAFDRYHNIVFHNNPEKAEDIARIAVFLDQLITSTLRRLDQQLVDPQGACWHLDCGEGFSTWRQAHSGELITQPYQLNDYLEGRRRLYYQLADPRIRLVFTRSNYYEEAIMAGYGLILQIAVCVLLVSPTWICRCISQERILVRQTLGVQASDWITQEAKQWYRQHFISSGWQQAVWHFFIPTEAERQASVGMENFAVPWFNWISTRLQVLFTLIFQCGYRLAQMKVWGSMIFVLLIPALLDGVLMRRIKKTNFDYASPVIQHYSLQALGLLLLGQLILWLSPIAVSPLITPVIIMICCVLLGLSISHLQKRI